MYHLGGSDVAVTRRRSLSKSRVSSDEIDPVGFRDAITHKDNALALMLGSRRLINDKLHFINETRAAALRVYAKQGTTNITSMLITRL